MTDTSFLSTHIKKPVLTPMEKEGAVSVVKSETRAQAIHLPTRNYSQVQLDADCAARDEVAGIWS